MGHLATSSLGHYAPLSLGIEHRAWGIGKDSGQQTAGSGQQDDAEIGRNGDTARKSHETECNCEFGKAGCRGQRTDDTYEK